MKITCPKCKAQHEAEASPGDKVTCTCDYEFTIPQAPPEPPQHKHKAISVPPIQPHSAAVVITGINIPMLALIGLIIKLWIAIIIASLLVFLIPTFIIGIMGISVLKSM